MLIETPIKTSIFAISLLILEHKNQSSQLISDLQNLLRCVPKVLLGAKRQEIRDKSWKV